MKRMRLAAAATLLTGFLFGGSVQAQIDDQAKSVLEESATAISEMKSATFQARNYGLGPLAGMIDASGEVKIIRTTRGVLRSPGWFKGQAKRPGDGDVSFLLSSNGSLVTWIDHERNTVFKQPVTGRNDGATELKLAQQQLVIDEMFKPTPYSAELKQATALEIVGAEKIENELCDVVKATYQNGARSTTWWISIGDRLPRKVERATGKGDGRIALVQELWDFNGDANLKPEQFTLAVPAGYRVEEPASPVPAPNAQKPAPAATVGGLAVGRPAPNFELKDTAGKMVSLESLKGNVVVLDFWGTWCAPCHRASPVIQKLSQEFKDEGVKVFGIACRERKADAPGKYMKDNNYTYGCLLDGDSTAKTYLVKGYPSFYVLDANGNVVEFHQGLTSPEVLETKLRAAIEKATNG